MEIWLLNLFSFFFFFRFCLHETNNNNKNPFVLCLAISFCALPCFLFTFISRQTISFQFSSLNTYNTYKIIYFFESELEMCVVLRFRLESFLLSLLYFNFQRHCIHIHKQDQYRYNHQR